MAAVNNRTCAKINKKPRHGPCDEHHQVPVVSANVLNVSLASSTTNRSKTSFHESDDESKQITQNQVKRQ